MDTKLTDEERQGINYRNSMIAVHQGTAELLRSELNLFTRHLIASKGLDPEKEYTINDDGALIEVE